MRSGTLAFFLGILTAHQLSELPNIYIALLLPLFIYFAWKLPHLRWLCLFAVGFLWLILRAQFILMPELPAALENQDLTIIGTISGLPKRLLDERQQPHSTGSGHIASWSFDFLPTQLLFQNESQVLPGKIRLSWSNTTTELFPNQTWQLTVRLKRARSFMNFGVFDYSSKLFEQQIRATGYVRDKKQEFINNTKLLSNFNGLSIDDLRYTLAETVQKTLGNQQSTGVLIALAIGDQERISAKQWEIFRRTGIIHLVSISGIHITAIAALFFLITQWITKHLGSITLRLPAQSLATWVGLLAAVFYSVLSGFSIPTQRTLIMLAVVMINVLFSRETSISYRLALAILLVLLWNPLAVLSIGFWLSFGAIVIILYIVNHKLLAEIPSKSNKLPDFIKNRLWLTTLFQYGQHIPIAIRNFGKLQLFITIAMLPLLLAIYGYSPLLSSLVANAIAIPWVTFVVVPFDLLGTVLILPFPTLGNYSLQFSAYCMDLLFNLLDFILFSIEKFTNLGELQQAIPPAWTVLTAMIGVAILLLPKGLPGRWLGIIWGLPLFFASVDSPKQGEIWFTLLDVGQGLSAVVRTQHHVLVFDAGKAIAVPFLAAQGIYKIDKLVISHGDSDHSSGVLSLQYALSIEETLTSAVSQFKGSHPCAAGQRWHWDGVEFFMLHPPKNSSTEFKPQNKKKRKKTNDTACVLKISNATHSILLTSDIEKATESYLVTQQAEELRADILLVSHHGSRTSSTEAFIDAVKPKLALVSTGYKNRFHFPRQSIVKRYETRQIQLLNTAETGAIRIHLTNDNVIQPILARETMRRYWHDRY